MKTATLMIWFILVTTLVILLILVRFPPNNQLPSSSSSSSATTTTAAHHSYSTFLMDLNDSWMARLAVNLLGYSLIIIPGFIIKKLVQRKNYLEQSGDDCTSNLIRSCFFGDNVQSGGQEEESSSVKKAERSTSQKAYLIIFCFLGLQSSYLIWGLLQERIMTIGYKSENGKEERFRDSQFLVFVNRILAFVLSGLYVLWARQPRHKAPVYKYSFCSFSNIMSSWCQYEALKYVNFPIQVLAKASKIIPVMLMGKLISRKTYEYYEYVSAVIISIGMTMFLFGSSDDEDVNKNHEKVAGSMSMLSGGVILAGYMVFDSFTSNWQGELFKQHSMTSMQMMCGVNLFSVLFTSVSLIQQGGFIHSFDFMWSHSAFVFDIVILSLTSATGQLFIFYTIWQFGPVIFTIMMTIRQLLAVILSCIIYHHPIAIIGIFGIILVFTAIFLRIYCAHRKSQLARTHKVPLAHKV